jgi:hypothetical protein
MIARVCSAAADSAHVPEVFLETPGGELIEVDPAG